ncbi:hypothetical protein [Streptococcus dysgalactiae]|uniref:hypothetical protein n=1 Tax=Streptococcus dysgalactiae TaxID=1334 RepID=UPI0010CAC905|nr:hypothetical protein [Streptococcus dysgalactiae]MDY2963511.1 hypothetical protein [Streptococcus dysgalactiae]MEC4578258.1 hypothetical protein [Streptococcus dysgalactiae]VTT10092.1 Uncharacterised protein [Streptococcus dysgalactiae]
MNNLFLFEYEIKSLSIAIYSITSWFPNRRFLGIVDKLNRDFIRNESKILGTTKIDTYNKFIDFFNKVVENYRPEFPKEEFPIDVGNVRFYSNDRFHKVFIGNGNEDTYESLFIIESLIHDFEQFKEVWYEILDYEDSIISLFEIHKNEFIQDEFECPPENYFNLIVENYNNFHNNRIARYFEHFTSNNEELYPFFTPQYKLPVFLPLMKETFIEKVEDEIDRPRFEDSVWLSFWRRLNCNFTNFFEREGNSFFNLRLIHRDTKEKIDLENTLVFLYENKLVVLEQNNKKISESLKEGIVENYYQIAGLGQDGEVRLFEFKTKGDVIFVGVKADNISPNIDKSFIFADDDEYVINASALIGIINNSDSIKEIVDFFIAYNTNKDRIMSFANEDAVFRTWKSSNYIINEGASPLMLALFAYESVHCNMELFDKVALNYPFEIQNQFYNIHSWKIVDKEQTDLSLISKAHFGSVDILSDGKKKIIYQELHFILEDISIHDYEMIKSYNEIVLNALQRNKELILSNCEKDLVEINVVSKSVLDRNISYRYPLEETEYFSKVVFVQGLNHQITLVAPRWDKIFKDCISKTTLEFENTILLNLLEGLFFRDRREFFETVKQTDDDKRTSRVFEVKVEYFVQPILEFSIPETHSFKGVRKNISKIIKKLNLVPGMYSEGDLVGIVRRFRNEIREGLASTMALYNQDDLNIKLQNELSSIIFNIDIQKRRLTTFSIDRNLQDDKLDRFRKQSIDLREEARVYQPILEYLIEENLITERTETALIPNDDIVKELIAYGKYILDFQLLSDAYTYGASNWFQLEIEDNYVINISETEQYLKFVDEIKEAKYTYGEYMIRNDEIDHEMIGSIKKSFFQDTKLDFDSFICFLSIFSSNGCITELKNKHLLNIHGNVVQGKILDLAKFFEDTSDYSSEYFYGILKFLALEKNKITENGVIPIWEKKKRENKFSSKPIIVNHESITFSPIILYRLKKDWVEGFMNFILPYDVGMPETLSVMGQWKGFYEQQIVRELKNLFKDGRYVTYIDQELYKLDTKGNHPRDLGDYDLIVIDTQKKEILLFEVKYMRLSQTMKDSMGDQKEYFSGKKAKGLKYKRRIEYFEENLDLICQNLALEANYTLRSYFLTNKIIRSNFVEYPFEIISYNEFKQLKMARNP